MSEFIKAVIDDLETDLSIPTETVGKVFRALKRASAATQPTPPDSERESVEQSVMVCPQCEGEGFYADGFDEAACSTECTRCGSNGWIVDVAAMLEATRAGNLLLTVDMIETVPIEHPFSDRETDPIWRIEVGGYCADFEHSDAANNFALAVNDRWQAELTTLRQRAEELEQQLYILAQLGSYTMLHPDEDAHSLVQDAYSQGVSRAYQECATIAKAALGELT